MKKKRMWIWITIVAVIFIGLQLWGRLAPPPSDLGPTPQLRGVNPNNGASIDWQLDTVPQMHAAFDLVQTIIAEKPRTEIVTETVGEALPADYQKHDRYLHAVSRSLIFAFPDDVEVVGLVHNRSIQIQSQARCGSRDFGVNAKRVLDIQDEFASRWPAYKESLDLPDAPTVTGAGQLDADDQGEIPATKPTAPGAPMPDAAPGSDTDPADPTEL